MAVRMGEMQLDRWYSSERERERERETERERDRERERKGISCSLINMDQEYCHNCQFGALKLESWGSSPLGALLL